MTRTTIWTLAITAAISFLAMSSPARAEGPGPLRVLFVGNSYTYGNDLPRLVEALAEASDSRKIVTDRCVFGGFTLERHVEKGDAAKKIGDGRAWDYVVLQEQSMRPVVEPHMTLKFAKVLGEKIKAADAQPVFFLTWARQHIPEMQAGLDRTYGAAAEATGGKVAPVGPAWKKAFADIPGLVLHTRDKSHPNPAGSYLAACVFYATLTGESPVGLPGTLGSGGKTLVQIEPTLARQLQTIAWETAGSK